MKRKIIYDYSKLRGIIMENLNEPSKRLDAK